MLLLAVDTSGKQGSIALAECDSTNPCSVLETVPLAGGVFSAQLVPEISTLLARHGRSKNELGAFAVTSGPGSFTGLRVGLAAIKGLAEALQKPIVAISLLEATAFSATARGSISSVLDAGRQDVYVGDYEFPLNRHAQPHMLSERLLSRNGLLAEAKSKEASGKILVTADAALAEIARSAFIRVELIAAPDSATIARLGWKYLQRGETIDAAELEANYIRRSDAELFLKIPL